MTLLNVFAENGNGNVDNHIGMQGYGDGEVTNGLEWTLWQANLGFVDIEALFGQCFCDIEIGDGTEQTAVHTGFLQDLDSQTSQFFALGLGICQLFCRSLFQFGAFRFKFLNGGSGSAACHTLGNQVVAGISVLDFYDITEIAEVADFIQQNYLHFFLQYSLDYPAKIRRNAGKCKAAGPKNERV